MDMKEAVQLLKDQGYKYTGKRIDMLEFLKNSDRYVTAKEILEDLKSDYPNISFDTIYRNLSLFTDLGILEMTELSGEKHFRFRCSIHHHHHHFICLSCGKTKEIHTCPMDEVQKELDGYLISDHKFEIYGYCKNCTH
ncbi:transcriptional repressor [Fervidibacillus halotolerans]|uniref:Transcriptional repressor n=1 Tax=Fervidibacillus halotolerans TaxID=2980027 RepID=A0A9E8RXQ5_9BACI|nr:Fur family transcriptional regulator [Fervidibacillus halotolerans]WAA11474.1 transcriptional repressor [Fervidibacillus halotolerans]